MNVLPAATPLTPMTRRGFTTPVVVLVLLVFMLGMALILDRIWLEAARLELTTAAEAAALAAARELATDNRLRSSVPPRTVVDEAVQAAVVIAQQNRVAGQPVLLEEQDVTFPASHPHDSATEPFTVSNPMTSWEPFAAAAWDTQVPTMVQVQAHRTRYRGNPVALWISGLTRQPFGDAVGQATAEILSPVVGVRPLPGSTVPALPLAILWRDPTGERRDTWQAAIEDRGGADLFGVNPTTLAITDGPDGIPELTLQTLRYGGAPHEANVQLLDIGSQFDEEALKRQWQTGWNPSDLQPWGGELRLPAITPSMDLMSADETTLFANTKTEQGQPSPPKTAHDTAPNTASATTQGILLRGLPTLQSADLNHLSQQLGVPRIVLLYRAATPEDRGPAQSVDCVQFVAIRVLKIIDQADGSCRVIVQPTVIATRTALVPGARPATPSADTDELLYLRDELPNGGAPVETEPADAAPSTSPTQYIYRLQLTDAPTVPSEATPEIAIVGEPTRS